MRIPSALIKLALIAGSLFSNLLYAQPYERAEQTDRSISFSHVEFAQSQIYYAYAGDVTKPGILFIHGTPGDWSAFEAYLGNQSLQKDYFMVSVDRMGWGKSELSDAIITNSTTHGENQSPTSFTSQSNSLARVMQHYPEKQWLLVGHSLGASIAPKLALDETHKVAGMLLLAGSLQPKLGRPRWFNRIANTILLRWLLPTALRYSNDEIMVLREELQTLESELSSQQLNTEVVVMQGMKDRLVSPKNADYVERTWPKTFSKLTTIKLPEAGHFLPWQQTDLVVRTIRQFQF